MQLIFCMKISMNTCFKLSLWFWWRWSSIPKVSKVASLQCLYNITKTKLEMKLTFCMQINIKVSYKLISTLWTSTISTRWYYHYWWAWSSILKILKVTSLQYLYNIWKKVSNGLRFLLAGKHQNFYKLALSFLMKVARHVQSTQNRTFAGCPLYAVIIVKNILFLVPTGKVRTFFPKCFLIKAWLSVEKLFPVEKIWKMARNLGAHPAWLLNPTISKFWHSSYMVITFHNLKILLSLLLLSHPTISNFNQPANWNFFGLVIPLNYNSGFPLGQGSHGKSENLLKGQGKSGKLEIFWKKSGKRQGIKFLPMQFFNFNKKIICTQKCV